MWTQSNPRHAKQERPTFAAHKRPCFLFLPQLSPIFLFEHVSNPTDQTVGSRGQNSWRANGIWILILHLTGHLRGPPSPNKLRPRHTSLVKINEKHPRDYSNHHMLSTFVTRQNQRNSRLESLKLSNTVPATHTTASVRQTAENYVNTGYDTSATARVLYVINPLAAGALEHQNQVIFSQ